MEVELRLTKRQTKQVGQGKVVVLRRQDVVYSIGIKSNETAKAKLLAAKDKIEKKLALLEGFKCGHVTGDKTCEHISPTRSGLAVHRRLAHDGKPNNLPKHKKG